MEEVILQQDPYGPASDTSALLRGYGSFRTSLPRLGKVVMLCCRSALSSAATSLETCWRC